MDALMKAPTKTPPDDPLAETKRIMARLAKMPHRPHVPPKRQARMARPKGAANQTKAGR